MGDVETIHLGPGQMLAVQADTPDRVVVVSTWSPNGTPGPSHYHPEQTEHFEVLEGVLTVEQDGRSSERYEAGATLTVGSGVAHRMWNASDAPTQARWVVTPALGTLAMWRGVARGGVRAKLTVLLRHRREFRLRGIKPPAR